MCCRVIISSNYIYIYIYDKMLNIYYTQSCLTKISITIRDVKKIYELQNFSLRFHMI